MATVIDLGFRCRKWQEAIFESLLRFAVLVIHRRAGKTLLAVMKLIDSALRCTRERGRFAYLAPELKQAKGIAWDYLKHYALKYPGTTHNESELWVEFPNGARVRLYGADNPNSLRGMYFDGVVVDEVAQMPLELWGEVLVPALNDSGRHGWALFIGTPQGINLFSDIYFKADGNSGWYRSLQTVYQTDVFTPIEIEELRGQMTPSQFRQEMMCDFQASNDNALISLDAALEASHRQYSEAQISYAPRIMGVDVAWTGGDRCVIAKRQGLALWPLVVKPGLPEKAFSAVVSIEIDAWHPDRVFIDTTGGYGGEVLSRLRERGYPVEGVVFSWKASEERFQNIRAEMWWKMAEWIKGGASIPKDNGLISELCAPTYSNDNAANRIVLESKDDVKARLGMSPDLADAVALCHAFPVAATSAIARVRSKQHTQRADFDPLRKEVFGKDWR